MKNTFGNSKAAKYLEDLLEKYPTDKANVSKLLTNVFSNLNNIEKTKIYPYLSQLIIDDFSKNLENSIYKYSHEDIKTLMRNLVVAKRKVELERVTKIKLRKKAELASYNDTLRNVSKYLISNNLPDFTLSLKYNSESKHIIYNMAKQIKKKEQQKGNPIISNDKVLICNNCKDIWIAPKEKCLCGSTTLTKTHDTNKKFARNYKE